MSSFWMRRSTLILVAIYLALALVVTVFAERALDALVGSSASLARLGAFRALLLAALAFPFAVLLVVRRLRRPTEGTAPPRRPAWLSPSGALIALAVTLIGTGLVTYRLGEMSVTPAVNGKLEAIAKLKSQLIVHWLDERDDDLQLSVGSPQFLELLDRWRDAGMRNDLDRQQLLDTLWRLSKTSHYLEISLRSADSGALLLTTTGDSDAPDVRAQAVAAARVEQPVLEDLHTDTERATGHYVGIFMAITEPGNARVRNVLHVAIDPATSLFPLIEQWTGAASTAEILLMRREGGDLVMLNELPEHDDASSLPRVALTDPEFFAAPLARGRFGAMAGLDDRNVSVLAYVMPVPRTPWFLAAIIDRAQAYSELNTVAFLCTAVLLVLLMMTVWWWAEHQRFVAAGTRHRVERDLLAQRIDFLAKFVNDSVMLSDPTGRIVDVNERCLATYGYTREEILSLTIVDLRAPQVGQTLSATMNRLAEHGSLDFETEHRRKDNSTFPVEVQARTIDIEGERFVQVIVRDISERKIAEARIVGLSRLYATISAVNQAIVRGRTLDDVFLSVCSACVDHGSFVMAWVGLADTAEGIIARKEACGTGLAYLNEVRIPSGSGDNQDEPAAVAYREQRVFVANNLSVADDPLVAAHGTRWRIASARHGFAASIAVPLRRGGQTIGVLAAYSGEANTFGVETISLLKEMADNLSFALDNFAREESQQRAEAALRSSEARLKQAQAIGRIGDWEFDRAARQLTVSREVCRMLDIAPVASLLDLSLALKSYAPRSVARIKAGLCKVIRTRQSVEVELQRADADHVLVVIPEFGDTGRVRRLYGTVQDVTARRRLEAERAEHVRRLAELSRRVVSTQEEERRRLSVELHDRTGANLAAIRLNLTAIEDTSKGANSKGGELLREARELLADTIVSIREFCADLRPALLDYAGLVATLQSSAQQFSRRTGVPVRVVHEEFSSRIAPEMESLLFRIAQEALTNCAKHAHASSVLVRLENSGAYCRLTVTDDGVGFDPAALGRDGHPAGQGLLNMRERAEFAGGRFSVISKPGKGTRIRAEFTHLPEGTARVTDLAPRSAVRSRTA